MKLIDADSISENISVSDLSSTIETLNTDKIQRQRGHFAVNFLFWNTNNKEIDKYILDIVSENKIDIAIFAEYGGLTENLCRDLGYDFFELDHPGCNRIKMLSHHKNIRVGPQNHYYSIQILGDNTVLCALHLPSKLHQQSNNRQAIVRDAIENIERIENKYGSEKSIVIGDFNDNPYDSTCLSADTLHGLPSYNEAKKNKRRINGKEYRMFYNPMWNLLGDEEFPPGTYYYSNNDMMCSFWYMFDQVLFRPQLRDSFDQDSLKILYKTQQFKLIDENQHPDTNISDHLPLVFSMEI